MSKSDNVKKLMEKALSNIEKDRKNASLLLEGLIEYLGEKNERHSESGLVAAKYLEVMNKATEQMVKIASLIQDSKDEEFGDLDNTEKDDFYAEFEKIPEKRDEEPSLEAEEKENDE